MSLISSVGNCDLTPHSSEEQKPIKKIIGFFYKIKDPQGNTRGYLLGTVHDLSVLTFKPDFDKKIQRSFDKSTALITEVSMIDEIHTFSEEEVIALQNKYDKSPDDLMDFGFMHAANLKWMPVHGLETKQFQNDLLERCEEKKCEELQRKCSELSIQSQEALQQFLSKQKASEIQSLSEAYEENSEEKLETFVKTSCEGIRKEIIDDRNEKWVDKINSLLLKEKGRFFITVGAGHLVGDQGICKLLSEKYHWQVEKKYLSTEKPDTQASDEQAEEDPMELLKTLTISLQKIAHNEQKLSALSELEESLKKFASDVEQAQRNLDNIF